MATDHAAGSSTRGRISGRAAAFLVLVVGSTGAGSWMMLRILAAGGFTALEGLILALFLPTFAWIVVPFWTSLVGFVRILAGRAAPPGTTPSTPLATRTAVVMPVFNEDPDAVAARLGAVAASLEATGQAAAFDLHLLSDTRDAEVARAEEAAWAVLQATHPATRFHYRRRETNTGRKAGNISEFTSRCVDDYDFMVVLDADSVMDGSTLVRLAAAMEAEPTAGLIQTVPLPVRQQTLFGRLVQFAGCLYGPVLAAGQAWWQGGTANYWGHNAIVRLRPFAEHARLPVLPGSAPLGGEVLSHDFVEAALVRRAGWKVLLDPTPAGSWEEVPTTVIDYARRDRRWAQGSLQHLRLLGLPGLHPLSRLHMLLGAFGYLTSPLWLLFLLAGTAYVFFPGLSGAALVVEGIGQPGAVSLLGVTAVVLFVPKLLGLLLGLVDHSRAVRSWPGLVASAALETLFSVLLAPLMMVVHTRFVAEIASGRDVKWDPALRTGGTMTWPTAMRAALPATLVGAAWGAATLAVSPSFFVWMSPIFAGLVLSAPLVRWSGSQRLGEFTRRVGLFISPFERVPPPEIAAVDRAVGRDPTPPTGVQVGYSGTTPDAFMQDRGSMHNAERGLFDLSRGRPLLIRSADPGGCRLVAAVETLDGRTLERVRALGSGPPALVVTRHRAAAMGLRRDDVVTAAVALHFEAEVPVDQLRCLSSGPSQAVFPHSKVMWSPAPSSMAGLALVRLARLIPAVVSVPVTVGGEGPAADALASGEILQVGADEVGRLVGAAGATVERISEAPVPLADSVDSRFILFRESHGLGEHVAILVGTPEEWPDPVPVRLHSACLTGDLFGSQRCDCGEQLRGSMEVFRTRGGGVLLYLAQEGRGIGLGNKFRAYTLQETGLDTIDADEALGFGADERTYDIAARILEEVGVHRIELLTNNPEKVEAMEAAGLKVVSRSPLHGRLNRHNLPYVRAKVKRAGHWLGDMLSQEISGD